MATIVVTEPDPEPLLTPAEVAALYRCDPKTVTRWAQAGKIHSIRTPGNHRRYYEAEIRAMLRGETWEPPGGWPASAAA
jgi:excisionase family DNA binding protein